MATIGQQLSELATGDFLNLGKIIPAGSLELRKLASGALNFYWRFTHAGRTQRQSIGVYDSSAPPKSTTPTAKGGYSIEAARRAAQDLAGAHHAHKEIGGHAALKAAKTKAKDEAAAAARQAAEYTLSKLLDAYVEYLKGLGRSSYSDAKSIFQLHIKEPFPAVASKPANKVEMPEVVALMRRVHSAGMERTSNKLRSYVRAAYAVAQASNSNAAIPKVFQEFAILRNPVADTVADSAATKADKRPLSLEEMRLYWRLIANKEGFKGALLRLHLLTGAQRIAQLVKLKTTEISDGTMLLWDGKGKPGKPPRANPIPLSKAAAKALSECKPQGLHALSTDGGKTHVAPETLSEWSQDAVGDKIPSFQAKRLRSGVETLLAKAKVPKEVRGRLQSHGVGGVQDANYNGYDYVDEKREALHELELWLTKTPELKARVRRSTAGIEG
jgi:integrase